MNIQRILQWLGWCPKETLQNNVSIRHQNRGSRFLFSRVFHKAVTIMIVLFVLNLMLKGGVPFPAVLIMGCTFTIGMCSSFTCGSSPYPLPIEVFENSLCPFHQRSSFP